MIISKLLPFFIRISSILLAYIVLFLISNEYGLSAYGTYSYYIAFIFVYSAVLRFGFDVLILRYNDSNIIECEVLPMFYCVSIFETLLSIGLLFLLNTPWQVLLASHLFASAFVLSEIARKNGEPLIFILFTNTLYLLFQLSAFWLFGFSYLLEIILFSFFLNLLILTAYLKLKHRVRLLLLPKFPNKRVLSDAFNSILIILSNMMDNHGTVFILSFFTTPQMLGVFSISRRLSNGIGLPYQVLNMVNAPKFLELRDDAIKFQRYLKEQMKEFFILGFVLPLILIPGIFLVPNYVAIPKESVLTFYVISIIFFVTKAIDGLTGPSQTLIRLFGSLKRAARAQVIIYFFMGTVLILGGVLSKRINLNIVIISSLLISASLTLINVVFVYLLKKEKEIDLVEALPRSWKTNTHNHHS